MKTVNNRFAKHMRLTADKDIKTLFSEGKAFFVFPFRIVYKLEPINFNTNATLQMAPIVSKKKFKRAVDRNYLKRVTKETYRTKTSQISAALEKSSLCLQIIINYTHVQITPFESVENAMQKIANQLCLHIKNFEFKTEIHQA
jgi:ribonuclease P protein component